MFARDNQRDEKNSFIKGGRLDKLMVWEGRLKRRKRRELGVVMYKFVGSLCVPFFLGGSVKEERRMKMKKLSVEEKEGEEECVGKSVVFYWKRNVYIT